MNSASLVNSSGPNSGELQTSRYEFFVARSCISEHDKRTKKQQMINEREKKVERASITGRFQPLAS